MALDRDEEHYDCDKMQDPVEAGTKRTLLYLDQFHHSGYQNTSLGLGHSVQIPESISYRYAERHTVVLCFYVLALSAGRFLAVQTMVHPRMLFVNKLHARALVQVIKKQNKMSVHFIYYFEGTYFIIVIKANSFQSNNFMILPILGFKNSSVSAWATKKKNRSLSINYDVKYSAILPKIYLVMQHPNFKSETLPSPIFSNFSYFCIFNCKCMPRKKCCQWVTFKLYGHTAIYTA